MDETPEEREQRLFNNMLHREGLTLDEVATLIKSSRADTTSEKATVNVGGKRLRFMYLSDTHIGCREFQEPLFERFVKTVKKMKPEFVAHPGDHVEGMSGRPGHIYELSHIGLENQISYCADLYNQIPVPIFGIDGNHDQWFFKKNNGGAVVGKELEARVKNFTHLGQDEGRINIGGDTDILLFHPGGGSAYASSYRLQKLIESFTEGNKPAVVLEGHFHKALYMFTRGVHGFECGTMSDQSSFMRGKSLKAHMGYGMVDLWVNNKGVTRLRHEWFPHYKAK